MCGHPKQEAAQILSETCKKSALHPQPSSSRPVLSKHRITSILRNTYNQVSFQLQLHKHEDVHERAEVALTRRKSRRRAKAAASSASHQHHPHHPRNPGGTAETNRSSSMTLTAVTSPSTPHTPADTATPRTVSRATGVE
ncbi:unnamed protein product, partial [Ectocarpus sp. 8 AP-2014]